eukprot:365303-Chlamydomonas_euryale.AAC.8
MSIAPTATPNLLESIHAGSVQRAASQPMVGTSGGNLLGSRLASWLCKHGICSWSVALLCAEGLVGLSAVVGRPRSKWRDRAFAVLSPVLTSWLAG